MNIDKNIAYRIGRAVAQHFGAKSVVIGFDARETSPTFAEAEARGVMDAGADVFNIGMAGTEEMYWAVTEFDVCAGIEVTASHNPINYNGMKIVKSQSRALDDADDFQLIKARAGIFTSSQCLFEDRDGEVYVDLMISQGGKMRFVSLPTGVNAALLREEEHAAIIVE